MIIFKICIFLFISTFSTLKAGNIFENLIIDSGFKI